MEYNSGANKKSIKKTMDSLKKRGISTLLVNNKKEALEEIKKLIPQGASINNGSSRTLEDIGLVNYLKTEKHGWRNLHAKAIIEKDLVKQKELRNKSLFADYYLGSVHAVAESGEIVIASASGSQLPPITYTSPNLILVVGIQKITPTLEKALERLRKYVVPLENKRMEKAGMGGTTLAKILILEQEPKFMDRKIYLIFVKEKLGF